MGGNQPTATDGSLDLVGLVGAARGGDEQAWTRLVLELGPRVFALAKSRLRDPEAAEEVTQSVFTTVAIKLRNGAYDEHGRFESWLFRIAMNRVRDHVRAMKRERDGTRLRAVAREEVEGDGPALPDGREADELRGALAQLSPKDREIVELRYHADMSFRQMADLLEEPVGTLLARHHRALRKIKSILEEQRAAGHDSGETGRGRGGARAAEGTA